MPDTGAPWNIPYVEPSDLVRNYPAANELMADAIAAGLTAAGGLVAVKSALFTGIQSASVTTGANVAVTDLTITHALTDAGNRLIISAFLGAAANSQGFNNVGLAVHDGTGLIAVGASPSARTAVTAGGGTSPTAANFQITSPSVTFVHAPGDTASRIYTLRAVNVAQVTRTIFINRMEDDSNDAFRPRSVSSLVIQEVQV